MKRRVAGAVALGVLALAAAGCSSSSSPSTTTAAGANDRAGATALGQAFIRAVNSKSGTSFCSTYAKPSDQAGCRSSFSELTGSSVTIKDLALGKVLVDGSRAVINFTASICSDSKCQTISNPNSAMANGESFDKAYSEASSTNSSGSDTALSGAAVEQGGRWYAVGF